MRKIFTLLSFMFVACSLSAQITWAQFAADEFAGGTGTADDPYLIETAEQFAKIAKDCDDGNEFEDVYFLLTADIDLEDFQWEPIGGSSSFEEPTFWGIIDGDGHKISNLKVSKTTYNDGLFVAGLVAELGAFGEIRNLTIESGSITGYASAGAFASMNTGLIINCTNYATVMTTGMGYAGGIAGAMWPSTQGAGNVGAIINCVNYGDITAYGNNAFIAGGIVGDLKGRIERCANFGMITAGNATAAGIAGQVSGNSSVINDCYNRGDIFAASGMQMGGIVGLVGNSSSTTPTVSIENCYNAAPVNYLSSAINQANSIIGYCLSGSGAIDRCYNNTDYCDLGFAPSNLIVIGANCSDMTTAQMTSSSFVTVLNSRTPSEEIWAADEDNINDGFPVLAFQLQDKGNAVTEVKDAEAYKLYGVDGSIVFEGEGNPQVRVWSVSGTMIYNGEAASLSGKQFAPGLYVVSAGETNQKVLVK